MSTASELARSGPLPQPRICCLDLDTFFVSVERVLDPTLEGKPVVVGGRPGSRGVVTAASYEVRRLGVKSGMSLIEAGKLAPDAIYLPTRGDTYGNYAERVREIARRFAPTVVVASIDEMFLDLTGCERLYGAQRRRERRRRHRARGARAHRRHRRRARAARERRHRHQQGDGQGGLRLAKPRGVMLVPAGVERARAGAAAGAVLPRHRPGRRGQAARRRLPDAGRHRRRAPGRAAEDLRRLGARHPAGRAGAGRRRARARAPGVLRARPRGRDGRQHLQRAHLPRGRVATPPRSNRCCAGCANGSAGARASATSRRAP